MIRQCQPTESERLHLIINEAATAYDGVIPTDCYHQPYMPREELEEEMARMIFYGWEEAGELVSVMGLEAVKNVTLIRHAYTLPQYQRRGIGSRLLAYLKAMTQTPRLLVGTWADAFWALGFYRKHGFTLLADKDDLLQTYWVISPRQIETSVVLGTTITLPRTPSR